ncbi:MAG: hypothetical protein GWP05_02190 [Anaerolineaceae bacterium]|nr:hypothetical protein [Anaerolineaceae bacterium]
MKIVRRIAIVLVALVVIVMLVGWLLIDRLVETGIEQGGTYALKVDTTVEDVSLSLLRGHLSLDGLMIANPPDFKSPHMMKSGEFSIGVERGSLMSDTIRLTEFTIDGLDIYIDQPLGKKSNVSVIMENVKRLGGDGTPEEKKEDQGAGGKKVFVDRVLVKNVVAHVRIAPLKEVTVKVPEIDLTNVSSEGEGIAMPDLIAKLLPPILMQVVKQGGGLLPPGALDGVTGDITGAAKALGGEAVKLMEEGLKNVGDDLGKGLDKTGKDIGEGLKDLLNKKDNGDTGEKKPNLLDNLLGGKKK